MKKFIISLFVIVVLWVMISLIFSPPNYLFPNILSVWSDFLEQYDKYIINSLYTLYEIIVGFIISIILGLMLSIISIHIKPLENILTCISIIFKTIPIIAIAPLLVLWFGSGFGSKIAAVAITSFIPILINVLYCSKALMLKYNKIITLYNMSKFQVDYYIIMPGIVNSLISSLKISSSLAIIGALVGEFISANKGLGYLIISNYYSMNIAGVFVCIIISCLTGIIIYSIFDYMEAKTQKYSL